MMDETWLKHANPWSGFTRLITFPLVYIPIWYFQEFIHDPLGYWYPLVGLILVAVWFAVNPRLFPKPRGYKSWMSKGVLGEKIWNDGRKQNLSLVLEIMSAPFFIGGIYTAYMKTFWPLMFFASVAFLIKAWFVDRMVFYYEQNSEKLNMNI